MLPQAGRVRGTGRDPLPLSPGRPPGKGARRPPWRTHRAARRGACAALRGCAAAALPWL